MGGPPSRRYGALAPALAFVVLKRRLERVTRLELATSSLARRCSTTELHPRLLASHSPAPGRRLQSVEIMARRLAGATAISVSNGVAELWSDAKLHLITSFP